VICAFFERLIRFVAVLNEDDEAVAISGGFDELACASDQSVRRVNRGAAITVEGPALNVDYEQGSGCHGIREPKVQVERPAATTVRTKKLRTGGSARTRG